MSEAAFPGAGNPDKPRGRAYQGRTNRTNRAAPNDCVDTPDWLADLMVEWAALWPGQRILEPCFGDRSLLASLNRAKWPRLADVYVAGFEIQDGWYKPPLVGFPESWDLAYKTDFLSLPAPGEAFNVALVNPPFSELGAIRFADRILDHWIESHGEGGRLITIMPAYCLGNSESRKREWWAFRHIHRIGLLPLNTYKAQGVKRFDGYLMDIRLYPREGGARFKIISKPEDV